MKKIYFLTILLVAFSGFSQNLAVNGDFESWTTGVLNTWTSEAGTTVEEESVIFNGGAKSAKITVITQTQANTDFQQTINVVSGVTYDVSFKVYALDNKARARLTIGTGFLNYNDDTLLNQWQTVTNTYTATATGALVIGLRFYDTAANWGTGPSIMYIDDFSFVAQSSPSIAITSPVNLSTTPETNVSVTLSVQNFTVANPGGGNGHIHYVVDGGPVVMKYNTTAILLTGLSTGSHTVDVKLVDDSHADIIPAVNATVTFTVSPFNTVTNISAVRTDVTANGIGKFYEITGEALVTYTRTTRNQKYIQDVTGALLIDDNAGTITSPFVIGDGMTGLKGQTSLFNGVLQIIPYQNITSSSTGNSITPQVVTAANITANVEMYESELVQINNATFTEANGAIVFDTSLPDPGPNYNLSDGASNIVFRTLFSEANYIGQIVPSAAQNIVVLVAQFTGTPQVVARFLADMPLETKSFNTIEGFTMYPNPVSGNTLHFTTTANEVLNVSIYDMLGKQIINTTVSNNTLNVSNLNAGIYIVKITEDGKTATRKLVVN